MDASKLTLTLKPAQDSAVIISANADLWTPAAGVNQDLGIWVSGVDQTVYPDGIVAWKESGGSAAYSPNAAFVQGVIRMTGGTPYTVSLKWKSNKPAAGSIYTGAGPVNGAYSPTRLIADVIPSSGSQTSSAVAGQQYRLSGSDGSSWSDLDPSRLAVTVKPSVDSMAIITANADLWTASAGYNQDLGIAVAGTDPNVYPAGIVGWKESGGSAAYAPNAATIEALLPVKAGSSYSIRLQWKINRPAAGVSIYAGAGSGPAYSPTRLTVRLLSSGSSRQQSSQQYSLAGNDGRSWVDLDQANLTLSVSGNGCPLMLSGNADLWTDAAGVNQDLAVNVNGAIVAWKESGGGASFSPNAAFVQSLIPTTLGTSYDIKLQWKANVSSRATIHAGAGPIGGAYSPTMLSVQEVC